MFSLAYFFLLFFIFFLLILLIKKESISLLYRTSLVGSIILFIYSLGFWIEFNPLTPSFIALYSLPLTLHYSITFGIDAISLFLVLLTTFLFPFCFLMTDTAVKKSHKEYILLFLLLEFLLILVFTTLDFFFFYVFFEFSLIPMFILIGWWGSRERKSKAAYYLFLFTLFGSLFMLFALLYFFSALGTTSYNILTQAEYTFEVQKVLWPAIFLAFAIKVPMLPFHIWLPEAHVEAPTAGSVLLAGVVLKLGGYGMIRYLLPLFPLGSLYYVPAASTLALMGAVYASLTALRQLDMKRIIAYSSIAHMNFGLLGLFSLTPEGFLGFYYLMLGHGLVSSALFFLVGVLYDRYHNRLYPYYSGLAMTMPLFASFFLFFIAANTAFPGTVNFAAEFLIFCGLVKTSTWVLVLGGLSLLGSAFFSFWLYNRLCFGTLNVTAIRTYYDLTRSELSVFGLLAIFTLLGGLFPNTVLSYLATYFVGVI